MTDSALPAPLVPAEVDLTNLPFMPIMIARLKQSRAWLICKRRPELAFYMLNLWTASWHSRPAASLEDDDDVLADLAMCQLSAWKKAKADVLRGWVRCADGRLHHPVVAEQALSAWGKKLAHREKMEAARAAKEQRRLQRDAGQGPATPTPDGSRRNNRRNDVPEIEPSSGSMIEPMTASIIEPDIAADKDLKVREGKVRDTSVLTDGGPSPPADPTAFRSVLEPSAPPPLRLVPGGSEPSSPADPSGAERDLFARAKVVAGANFGGQVPKLIKAKGGNIALARAAVETASTKHNAREYLARVIRGDDTGMPPGQLYDRSI